MNNRMKWYEIRKTIAVALIVTFLPFSSFAQAGVQVVHAEPMLEEPLVEISQNTMTVESEPADLQNPVLEIADDITLEEDWHITEEVVFTGGEIDLNGHTMTISSNFIHSSGTMRFNGGKLIVDGDYRKQSRELQEDATWLYGLSDGKLYMNNEDDYFLIRGNYYNQSSSAGYDYLNMGCIELRGDYIQSEDAERGFSANSTHTFLISGEGQQVLNCSEKIENLIGSIKITNISEEGVWIEGNHRVTGSFESERESYIEGILCTSAYQFVEQGYYAGSVEFMYSVYLRVPFEFGGDVYCDSVFYMYEKTKIKGNLYVRNYFYQNNDLTVEGNIYMSDSENGWVACLLNQGYQLHIKGDVIAETQNTSNYTGIGLYNENAYVLIGGDYCVYAPNCAKDYYLYNSYGTVELKGDMDFTQSIDFNSGATLILSGDDEQHINVTQESRFCILDIQNKSEGGVHFDSYINYEKIILSGKAYYHDIPMLAAYSLNEDTVIDGDVVLCGDVMSLNGHTLTVKGDLIQLGTQMQIDGGELLVEGSYYIGEPDGMWEEELTTYSNGSLYMTGVQDRVTVYGDLYMVKNCSNTSHQYHSMCESVLKAGTLDVKGDLVVRDGQFGYSAFETEENTPFTLVLSGDSKQRVWFDTNFSTTEINHLTITNTSDEGVEFIENPFVQGTILTEKNNHITGNIRIWGLSQLANGYYAGGIYVESLSTIRVNQKAEIGGDFINDGYLYMQDENSHLIVIGDFVNRSTHAYMENGTLELKGDFSDTSGITYDPAHRILFSDDERQTISCTATLGTIELQNPAGVYSERAFKFAKLITNGYRLIVADEEGIIGYTLTSDETMIGDLYLTAGVMDLNGHTLTVKGDVILQEGTIDINGGTLIVEGDYRQQFRNRTEEGFTYTESEGLLVMSEDEDKLQIMGDMILSPKSKELVGMENGTVILNGTEKQTVSAENPFTIQADLQIVNTSLQGVALEADIILEGQVSDLQYKTGGSGCVLISDFGQLENGRFGGNVELVADCYLEQNVTIHGDLTLSKTLYVETYKMSVDGNLYTTGAGKLTMEEAESYVLVKGNVEYATATNGSGCRFTDGILEVRGDYTDPNYTDVDVNHTLLLSGDDLQTVACNAYLGTLELKNDSEEGVYSANTIHKKNLLLNDCNLTIGDGTGIYGFTLEDDYVVDGNLTLLDDTLDLNGYTLTVKGDLILQEGILKVNNGTLIVEGDLYTYAKYRSEYGGNACGCLVMEHPRDLVKINGDWIMEHNAPCDCAINNGIIELQGDLKQLGYNSSSHIRCTLILNGTEKQAVYYHGLQIKELIVKNNSVEGVELVSDVTVTEKVTDENNKLTGKSICITDFAVVEEFEGSVKWTGNGSLVSDVRFGGDLTIKGTLDIGHASLVVDGNLTIFESGKLIMDEADAYVLVKGDYADKNTYPKNTFNNGVLEVKGNYTEQENGVYGNNHTLILSGDKLQTVLATSSYGTIELQNYSEEGVYSEYALDAKQMITNGCKLTIGMIDGVYGKTLRDDYTVAGDMVLCGNTMDLNGHTLLVKGDLTLWDGEILVNGGTLIVEGNLQTYAYQGKFGHGCLIMEKEDDKVEIGGNWVIYQDSNCTCSLKAGTIELKGNMEKTYGYSEIYDIGCHVVMNGDRKQELKVNSYTDIGNITFNNPSEEGIYITNKTSISGNINQVSGVVTGNGIVVQDLSQIQNGNYAGDIILESTSTLTQDITVDGKLQIDGELHCDGYLVEADNLIINGKLYTDNAYINVEQNLTVQNQGMLIMNEADAYVLVKENLVFNSIASHEGYLTNGTLEVMKNITVGKSCKGFVATGDHYTIFRRRSVVDETTIKQDVYLNTYASIHFANLELTKSYQNGYTDNYSVLESWADNVIYVRYGISVPSEVKEINVSATTEITVTLSYSGDWEESDIRNFRIYRNDKRIATTTLATYTDKGLEPNTTYTYKVYPCNVDYQMARRSPEYTVTTMADTQAPTIPGNLRVAVRTGSAVTMKWDKAGDNVAIAGYRLYRDDTLIYDGKTNIYKDEGLSANTLYTYQVKAYDTSGNESELSDSVDGAVYMPRISSVTPADYADIGGEIVEIKVACKNGGNSQDATMNIEYYDSKNDRYVLLTKTPLAQPDTTKDYTLTYEWEIFEYALEGDVDLRFTLTDEDGNQTRQVVTYVIDKTAPEVPTEITAQDEGGTVTINWKISKSADCVGYRLYRVNTDTGEGVELADVTGRNSSWYSDETIEDNTAYNYYVRAYDKFGNLSAMSDIAKVETSEDTKAPRVTAMTPASGRINRTTDLIVTGKDNRAVKEFKLYTRQSSEEEWEYFATVIAENNQATYIWDTTAYAEGNHYIKAVAVDVNGNESEELFMRRYEVDNTGIAKIRLLPATAGSTTIQLEWEDVEEADFGYFVVEEKINGVWVQKAKISDKLGYRAENLQPETTHTYRVTGFDNLGNVGIPSDPITVTTIEDTTAPTITKIQPTGSYYKDSIPLAMTVKDNAGVDYGVFSYTVSGNGMDGIYTEIARVEGTGKTTENLNHTWDISALPEGEVIVRFEAYDTAGIHNTLYEEKQIENTYIIDRTAPGKVNGAEIVGDEGAISLEWDSVSDNDIAAYEVERAKEGESVFRKIGQTTNTLYYTDTNVQMGNTYIYRIVAVDMAGNKGETSDEIYATIRRDEEAPVVTGISPGQEIIGNNPTLKVLAMDNAKLQSITLEYRDTSETDIWHEIATLELSGRDHYKEVKWDTDGLMEETVYEVRAKAVDATGNESEYVTRNYTLDLTAPQTPELTVKTGSFCIEMEYSENTEEDFRCYKIYRRAYGEKDYTCVQATIQNEFTDAVPETDTTYYYKVRAYDIYGNYSESTVEHSYANHVDKIAPVAELPETVFGFTGMEVGFDGTMSNDNVRINRYEWDFGDGTTTTGVRPSHTYEEAGTYNVTLTVRDAAGNESVGYSTVQVMDQTNTGSAIIKVLGTNGQAISGAYVYVKANETGTETIRLRTNVYGEAKLISEEGEYEFSAFAEGYMPTEGVVRVNKYETLEKSVTLAVGEVVTGNLTVRRLELEEMIELGVDLSAPENYHTFTFKTELWFAECPLPSMVEKTENTATQSKKNSIDTGKGLGTYTHKNTTLQISLVNVPKESEEEEEINPTITYLETTQTVSWLKDMYEVKLGIINNANSGYTITNASATLNLPQGMSLARTNSGQTHTTFMEDIDGQEKAETSWIVKGDESGTYTLSASFHGILLPFEADIDAQFEAMMECDVPAGKGLHIYVYPQDVYYPGEKYYIHFEIANESPRTLYKIDTTMGVFEQPVPITEMIVKDYETGEIVEYERYEGTDYHITDPADKAVPVLANGDKLSCEVLPAGESIYGTYCTIVDGDEDCCYRMIEGLITELEGENLGVEVTIKPIASHIVKYLQYIDPETGTYYGDPVDLTNGAFLQDISSFSVDGATSLSVGMHYNSMAATYLGECGYGWSHDYEQRLEDHGAFMNLYLSPYVPITFVSKEAGEQVIYGTIEDEKIIRIDNNACYDDVFYPASDAYRGWSLQKTENGYEVTSKDLTVYRFDIEGRLAGIETKSGEKVTISHEERNTTITDCASGEQLHLIYNEAGMLVQIKDNHGRINDLYYEGENLISFTEADGKTTTFAYDGCHRMTYAINALGIRYVENTYTEEGRVLTQKEAGISGTARYSYESTPEGGMKTTVQTYSGGTICIVTDKNGEKIKEIDENGATTEYIYDENGNLISKVDATGKVESYAYDENGNQIAVTDRDGATVSVDYDENGNVTTVWNANHTQTQYTYDAHNRLIRTTAPEGTITRYAYDESGNVIRQVNDGLGVISMSYESGRLVAMTDYNGNTMNFGYDNYGNRTSTTDALGRTATVNYDAAGKVLSETGTDGTVTTYTYDAVGQKIEAVTKGTDGITRTVTYTYDAAGRVTTETNENGTVTYAYDSEGNIISITYPNGTQDILGYDAASNPIKMTTAGGVVTEYAVDSAGNVIQEKTGESTISYTYTGEGQVSSITYADGTKITYTYDENGNCLSETDNEGKCYSYTYDVAGNKVSETDPLGNVVSYEYDIYGRCTKVTDPNDNITTYTYDGNGNCISATNAAGTTTVFTYDAVNRLIETTIETSEGEYTTRYSYDHADRVTAVTDAMGNTMKAVYDSQGNLTALTDAKGNVVETNQYDERGLLTETTDALGNTTAYSYDTMGNITSIIECLNTEAETKMSYGYDADGKLLSVTNAVGTVNVTYDNRGNLITMTDSMEGTTAYSYDSMNRVTEIVNAIGAKETYTYNARGLLETETDNAGEKTTYQYDAASRIILQKDDLGTIKYSYDKNGNILTVSDKNGTITRTYDELNRVTTVTDYNGDTIGYGYDELGNRISITYPGGEKVRYTYDKSGNLKSVTDAKGNVTYYSYDPNGRLTETVRGDGSREYRTYNEAGRLTVLRDETATGEVINEYTYEYDGSGNITSITGMDTGVAESAQESIDALIDDNPYDGITPAVQNADGTVTVAVSMTYDADNRLMTYNGQTVEYDEVGNMTRGPLNGAMADFTYDCRNRLVKVQEADGTITQYEYDAENIRNAVISNGIRTEYTTDRESTYSQTLVKTEYKKNALGLYTEELEQTTYTYGIGLISERRDDNQEYYYHYNHIGSTMAVSDASGTILFRFVYDTYGELSDIKTDNGISLKTSEQLAEYSLAELADAIGLDYLYNGQYGVETDQNGLYYMRARYYNQDIKRFINRDVVSGDITNSQSLNRYCYVQGNPVSLTDPFGLCPTPEEMEWNRFKKKVSNITHNALDGLGLVFDPADVLNAFLYLIEGEYMMAALSVVCMFPGLGSVLGIPARLVVKITDNIDPKVFMQVQKHWDDIVEAGKKLGKATSEKLQKAIKWIDDKLVELGIKSGPDVIKSLEDVLSNKILTNKTKKVDNYVSSIKGNAAAKADFDAMAPTNIRTYSNGIIAGDLPDGRTINIHPSTTLGGTPSLEIYDPVTKKSIKIRY